MATKQLTSAERTEFAATLAAASRAVTSHWRTADETSLRLLRMAIECLATIDAHEQDIEALEAAEPHMDWT
jgi:hypothetical protein